MTVARFSGIFAATVCPMHADETVDEAALAAHVATVAKVDGIAGLLLNGHAGENFMLTREEKALVIAKGREAAGDRLVIAGVNAEASATAALEAADAEAAGADALLVFPPFSWALALDPPVVMAHHAAVAAASTLPLFLYQAPVTAGAQAYPPEVLDDLIRLPAVAGIKEGSWEVGAYEANRRLVHARRPELRVMASGDEHLLACFMVGSEGSQVSLAALVPELIVALERAVAAADMARALQLHNRLYPLARAIYGAKPGSRATARLKYALARLGRIPSATTRAPQQPLDAGERRHLDAVLDGLRPSR